MNDILNDLAARVETADADALVALLAERHPIYQRCRPATVVRMRGWILQAFARTGLPAAGVPFVLEELESGTDAYLVAAAARAVRGGDRAPMFVPFLARAIERMRYRDDAVSFARCGAVGGPGDTTAIGELRATLAWLGANADDGAAIACCAPRPLRVEPGRRPGVDLSAVALQDHDGRRVDAAALLRGRPAVVAFFYTRCDNPSKCSLTIASLARLQRALREARLDVQLAAISYDGDYDLPHRLRVYGEDRGLVLGDDCRLLRCTAGWDALAAWFDLGVSRIGGVVGRHRIELFAVDGRDGRGRITAAFTRLAWDPAEVVAHLRREQRAPAVARRALSTVSRGALVAAPSIALALVPKCPLCWAAYASALGVSALERVPHAAVIPALAALVIASVAIAWRRGQRRGSHAGTALATLGALAVIGLGLGLSVPFAIPAGAALGVAAAIVGSLPRRRDRVPMRTDQVMRAV